MKREKRGQDVEDHPIFFPIYHTFGKWLERDYIGGGIEVRCLEDQIFQTLIAGLAGFRIPVHDLEEVFGEAVGGHVAVDDRFP